MSVLFWDKVGMEDSSQTKQNSIEILNPLGLDLLRVSLSSTAAGIFCAILIPILIFTILNRFARVYPKGILLVYAFLSLGFGLLGHLAYDPTTQEQREFIVPQLRHTGTVAPRELFWECCTESEYSQIKNWNFPEINYQKDFPNTTSWVRENAALIERDWTSIKPLREWFRRMNSFDGFDDFISDSTSPLLDIQAIKVGLRIACAKAILLQSQAYQEQALNELMELLSFFDKLKSGSRCLSTFAIGVAGESVLLKTLDHLEPELSPNLKLPRALFAAPQSTKDTENFSLVVLRDAQVMLKTTFLGMDQFRKDSLLARLFFPFIWNENRTNIVQITYARKVSDLISRWDRPGLKLISIQPPKVRIPEKITYKNLAGEIILLTPIIPPLDSVCGMLQTNFDLRAKLSSRFTEKTN